MSSLNYCEVISSPYTLDGFRLFCCRRPFCLKVLWVLYYFGRNNSKHSHNYNLLCSILSDWLATSLPRWLTSLEVFEFYHWYYVFQILCCNMSWLNQSAFTICGAYYFIEENWHWQAQKFPFLVKTWLRGFKIQNPSLLAWQLYIGNNPSVTKNSF